MRVAALASCVSFAAAYCLAVIVVCVVMTSSGPVANGADVDGTSKRVR